MYAMAELMGTVAFFALAGYAIFKMIRKKK